MLRGTRSLAEVGHTIIDWRAWHEGAPCTLEELGSGSGICSLARAAGLGALGAREIQEAAAAGEPRAAAIWEDAITACAAGVSNLVMCFSPDTVVVGGGQGRQEDFFGPLRERVLSRPGHLPDDLTIVQVRARGRRRTVRSRRLGGGRRGSPDQVDGVFSAAAQQRGGDIGMVSKLQQNRNRSRHLRVEQPCRGAR